MITCNWPDFTKRTAGTENSSLLSSQAIQFKCLVANWDRRQLAPNRHPRPQMRRAKGFLTIPYPLTPSPHSLHSWFFSHSSLLFTLSSLLGALRRLRPAKACLRTLRR